MSSLNVREAEIGKILKRIAILDSNIITHALNNEDWEPGIPELELRIERYELLSKLNDIRKVKPPGRKLFKEYREAPVQPSLDLDITPAEHDPPNICRAVLDNEGTSHVLNLRRVPLTSDQR